MLLCAIPILWAAITDFKKRIIPDWTWIVILLIGCVSAFFFKTLYLTLFDRIAGLLLPGVSLIIIAVKCGGIGGGDIKLTVAMGFCFGLYSLAAIIFFAVIPACIYAKAIKKKSIPLAVFLSLGYFFYISLSLFPMK